MNPTTAEPRQPLTIGSRLKAKADERGSQPYFICDDETLTYSEADEASRELARSLVAFGAGRSTHVGLLMPTGVDFVVAWLAVARIGAVAVPISTFSTADELGWLVRNADIGILIATSEFRGNDYVARLEQALPGLSDDRGDIIHRADAPVLRHIFVSDPPPGWPDALSRRRLDAAAGRTHDDLLEAIESDVAPPDRMVIVHTSGSTSRPKGVIHQHGPLITHLDNLNRIRGLVPGMRLFSNSPLFWIGGLGYNLVGVLAAGATLICSTATDAGETLDLIERERPEMCNGFAQTVTHLVNDPSFASRDFSSIRLGNLYPIMPDGVRPEDPELRHNMLGMTETGSVCLISPDESDLPEKYRGSFGRPVPELEARVVDPGTGALCGADEVGELWIRGPLLMEGYHRRERHETFTPDGWFRTGDMFLVDDEGFYYFKGRTGDMIKTSGANVSPREVESALQDVFPDNAVLVIGVDDPEREQIVVAIVIAPADVEVDEPSVRKRLRETLSPYKVPRRVIRMDEAEIPVLSSGKIDAKQLKESLRER